MGLDSVEWIALIVVFTVGYLQSIVFYLHEYTQKSGYSVSLQDMPYLASIVVPGFVLLIFISIALTFKNIAFYLAWNVTYENERTPERGDPNDDMDVPFAIYLISLYLGAIWTKLFFTPNDPAFFPALLCILFDLILNAVSLAYYSDMTKWTKDDEFETHDGAFYLQLTYVLMYDVPVLFLTFYAFFNSRSLLTQKPQRPLVA
jgi:hypothetical protein